MHTYVCMYAHARMRTHTCIHTSVRVCWLKSSVPGLRRAAPLYGPMAGVLSTSASGLPSPKRIRLSGKVSPFYVALLEELGGEDGAANQRVYLGTISRVLPGVRAIVGYRDIETLTRAELVAMIRDAFDDPVCTGVAGGRPRASAESPVDFVITAKEAHADGSSHFHFVVKLSRNMRFKQAKVTLAERHKLPSHWSCTHRRVWSAIRYLHVPSSKKPVVDTTLVVWTHDGRDLDLTELAREPFAAEAWRKRREAAEAKAAVEEKTPAAFTKLDFMALVLSKHLHTKASLLSYVQDHGSPAAQLFASKHQRRLTEFIGDAQEWADAKATAGFEKLADWDVLCEAADSPCKHAPGECGYALAVEEIFRRNAGTVSQHRLAAALRQVLVGGPSKTCRVPFLVGPSNTGKSTLMYPFDDLFGPKRVFHKPALGSTFALRNINKDKRFIFWDDYRPVEFAHKDTVPVATFLSVFIGKDTEVQVSQSFNDGDLDVKWQRGVVLIGKEEGLWEPTSKVSAEDVRHLRNRVDEFRFTHVVPALRDVESCAPCMARWIRKFSDEAAAAPAPIPVAMSSSPADSFSAVRGFAGRMVVAKLAGPVVDTLFSDVLALGAVDVTELSLNDWKQLPSWSKLRPLEVRRLAAAAASGGCPAHK